MDNNEKEMNLDSILTEFHEDAPGEGAETSLEELLSGLDEEAPAAQAPEEKPEISLEELLSGLDDEGSEPKAEDPTVRLESLEGISGTAPKDAAPLREPIEFDPHLNLRELKRKLVAGPEKRYYELSEIGTANLQGAILINIIVVLLCAGVAAMYALGKIPADRMRLMIFSQVLAMLISALTGSHLMLDGLSELGKGRFTVNTLLSFTFLACGADAVACLNSLRVPCCAAFSLEILFALIARYQRRTTEMAQMDTLRKAVRLNGMVKVPGYMQKKAGILRVNGRFEDFWDSYQEPSGAEKVQNAFALFSLIASTAIAILAGIRHGMDTALQIFSTSLLVAVPASFYLAITRPMSVLQKRLHMVGVVLCGPKGIRGFKGKAAFPLKDEDLFPRNSTKLNGIKFYGDRAPEEVISYTASLIIAAGGGLVHVFRQLLKNRDGRELPVKELRNYGSGGIGGMVGGEPVLLGSLDFLQSMGVEIPEGTMVNQAIYASIDGQLSAVVAISYAKMRSASAGLISLTASRKITPVMLGGDFMVTESLIRAKFGVRTRRMCFPTPEERRELANTAIPLDAKCLALSSRDELISYAYAISGARALNSAWTLGNVIHIIGGLVGLLVMAALAWLGTQELLVPTNILAYQLIWMVPGFLASEWTRTV